MIKKIYITFVVFSILYGQSEKYGGGPNAFYQLQTSAREAALGGAGIVTATGPFAALWNPSGIADTSSVKERSWTVGVNLPWQSSDNNFNLSTTKGISMFSLGILHRYIYDDNKNLFIGGNMVQRSFNDVIHTDLNINNEIQPIDDPRDYSQNLMMVSIAGYFDNIRAGAAIKSVISDIPGINILQINGIDAGYKLILSKNKWAIIEHGFVVKLDRDKRNTQMRYGWGMNFDFKDIGSVDINLASDIFSGENTNTEWATGCEAKYSDQAFLRVGINYEVNKFNTPRYWSLGGGLKYEQYIISGSYTSNYSEYLSLVDFPFKLDVIFKF